MNYTIFRNHDEIDVRSISTFGVSVKTGDNPIGYFGTGLKYAIAILLRSKHEVTIFSGLERYDFGLKPVTIRGKDFEVVTMNGAELPFTTELGKNWELWQAFRELYCNCIDEGGVTETAYMKPSPSNGVTYVVVKGSEFKKVYDSRDRIVLQLNKGLSLSRPESGVEVYDQESNYLYYRGVRVMSLSEPSLMTYNVLDELELTEDRTIKFDYNAFSKLPKALAGLTDKSLIRKVLLAPRDSLESSINFDQLTYWPDSVSPQFREVLEFEYNLNNDRLSRTAVELHKHLMNKRASKHYEIVELTTVEQKQAGRCLEIAKKLYDDFDDFKIVYVKTLGQNTLGLADQNERKIVISRQCFERGTKYLLSTMVEEYAHLKTGYGDRTRELQTWLFDNICTITENHILKEPI